MHGIVSLLDSKHNQFILTLLMNLSLVSQAWKDYNGILY